MANFFGNPHTIILRGTINDISKHKSVISEICTFRRDDPDAFPYTKYAETKESAIKLKASFFEAIYSLFKKEAAVGRTKKGEIISEYPNEKGEIEFALYSAKNGTLKACKIEAGSDKPEEYELLGRMQSSGNGSKGEAIILSLLPAALEEEEFKTHFDAARECFEKGTLGDKVGQAELCWMQSNLGWRISAQELKCSLNTPFLREMAENPEAKISKIGDIAKHRAVEVIHGEFNTLEPVKEDTDKNKEASFNGVYKFGEDHTGDKTIPVLPASIIVPPEAHICCGHIKALPEFRNILFRGEAGSGKSMLAKIIAAGIAKPFGIYTCSTNTEIFDLVGQILPVLDKAGDMSDSEKKLVSDISDIGGFSGKNISEILNMPSVEDIFFDTEGCYEALSGKAKAGVTQEETLELWQSAMNKQLASFISAVSKGESSNGAPRYTYTETPFLRAIRNGGVVELQEPNVIAQPGVMVGLNGVMEHGGSIVLPTGERVFRHPDAVVITTTNVTYEGCRDMNASLLDRMDMVFDINTPPVEVMVERTKAQTGFDDEKALTEMAQIVKDINAIMKEQGISDGTSGDRSLLSWALSAKLTNDIYTSALYTLIPKCTSNEEDRALLQKRLNSSSFASKRKKRI